MFDNITAISSGNINQPISIIRVDGPDAFTIVKKIFTGKIGGNKQITFGKIVNANGELIDEVLVSWFKSPNTFTGNNVVEINAHGGIVNTNNILKLLLTSGCRMAENGEFSRRAFMNGKMDLVKAEAIHDLIFSKTTSQAKLSVKKFDGKTSMLINSLIDELLFVIATIETNIDYPEYDDVESLTNEKLLPKLKEIRTNLNEILSSSNASRFIYKGVNVAIVGMPNVGKSSLLNAILNEDKAIVTNIPGTTRDIVEGSIQINQVLLNFKDTAGIHLTNDVIEKIGIDKSIKEIQNADLIIHLIDPTKDNDKDAIDKIKEMLKEKIYIDVYNKSDLVKMNKSVCISAKNKDITNLIIELENTFKNIDITNEKIIYNTRQLSLVESSLKCIDDALKGLESGMMPDEIIVDVRQAWKDLSNILGKASDSDLLDKMFKSFCLGK